MKVTTSELGMKVVGRDGAATPLPRRSPPVLQGPHAQPVTPSAPGLELASASDEPVAFIIMCRNTDELTQNQWSELVLAIRDVVDDGAEEMTLDTVSPGDSPWQQAAIGFLIQPSKLEYLQEKLSIIAGTFQREDIILAAVGPIGFIVPQYMTKETLEKQLGITDDSRWAFKGMYLFYTCKECGYSFATFYVDNGVTPMFLACRANEECEGVSSSSGRPQPDLDITAEWEWYRPEADRGRFSEDAEINEHVMRGGLLLREVGTSAEPQG